MYLDEWTANAYECVEDGDAGVRVPGCIDNEPIGRGTGGLDSVHELTFDVALPALHVDVQLGPERRWWQGRPINPYLVLR